MEQYATVQEGMMVGVYVEHHWDSKNPLIGKVLDIDNEDETFLIHWYGASWTGRCFPLYEGGGTNRKPKSELLDVRCIILWQFSLTKKKGALTGATVGKLKALYSNIKQN